MQRSRSNLLATGALLGALSATARAQAYCQTTTCDAEDPLAADACQYENGCTVNGFKLYWPGMCMAFSVQKDGSPLRGISWETMQAVEKDAYYQWQSVDCGGGQNPAIQLFDRSPVNCSQVLYNRDPDQPNANIWLFRDDEWPHESSGTLALTTVTFNPKTGEIYDADVEVNSAQNEITVGDAVVEFDLKSIVTHEAGHTLGLSHSPISSATMYSQYSPRDIRLRTLNDDDIQGICATYPPGQNRGACDATPRHGFSTECTVAKKSGCAVGPVRGGLAGWTALFGLALGLGGALGVRRRARSRVA